MEYQKRINLLENKPNEPSELRTKKWVVINDHSRGTCNNNSQIRFKNIMLKSLVYAIIMMHIHLLQGL